METLITIIEATELALGPYGPYILFGLVFLFLALLGFWGFNEEKKDPLNKFEAGTQNLSWTKRGGTPEVTLRDTSKNEFLEKYSGLLQPQDQEELSEIRKQLALAGYRSIDAVRWYYLSQLALALALAGLSLGWVVYEFVLADSEKNITNMVLYIGLPFFGGYLFPKMRLSGKVKNRRQELQDGFPDTLDMMLICVQTGQSLDQTLNRVARDIGFTCPPMGEELSLVVSELKAGKERAAVLGDFGDRLGVPDIKSFTTVMVQAAAFGTSVSDALSVYSAEMREKRVMRAEERAKKLPTKMTIATMMLSVPPLMMILLAPSVLVFGEISSNGLF